MIAALCAAGAFVFASPPSHVMDQAAVIPDGSQALLERKLVAFEDQHKVEVVIATFDSLGGRPESTVSGEIMRTWAVGSRTAKRGVLISYWKSDRATRIDMTDALPQFSGARASQIVQYTMIPQFKKGYAPDGLEAGADEVMKFLGANPWSATPVVSRSRRSYGNGKVFGGLGGVALVVVFVVIRIGLASAGFGGFGYRRGWGYRRGYRSSGFSSWGGSSRSSWGGGGGGGGGGFSGRGASGRW